MASSFFTKRQPLKNSSSPKKQEQSTPNGLRVLGKKPEPVKPKPKAQTPTPEVEVVLDEPGTYTDYKIFSHDPKGRRYNTFRFDSHKPVSLLSMMRPLKLNRKDPIRRVEEAEPTNSKLTPMLGIDGKPVVGSDGHVVYVDENGRVAGQHAKAKPPQGPNDKGKRKPFQKKTRQIFTIPEAQRQLRKEERYPWLLEDASGREVWVGQLEDTAQASQHAYFMTMPSDGTINSNHFLFVPSHRWYKMQKRPTFATLGLEEAEEQIAKISKSKNPQFWLSHNKGKISDATAATLAKAESPGPSSSGRVNIVTGPGGRLLKAVDTGSRSKFEEDDEFGDSAALHKKAEKELGEEGDIDEVEFEDEMADDDEGGELDAIDEEEAKELEERIKKEWRSANKTKEGYVDESDDEDVDMHELTGAGKDMKKLLKKPGEGRGDDNPYVDSDDEEEEEETPQPVNDGKPAVDPTSSVHPTPAPTTPTPGPSTPKPTQPLPNSRATSPVPQPGLGNSVVAKRATSPKPPHPVKPIGSRAGSPLATGSRAASPTHSRAGSPALNRSGTPSLQTQSQGLKRKPEEDLASPTSPTSGKPAKKPRNYGPVTAEMLKAWLRVTPDATTKMCITQFKKHLAVMGPNGKTEFVNIIKDIAKIRNGVLILKEDA